MSAKGKLYLVPTTLGDTEPLEVLPISVKKTIEPLQNFIVENEKSARRFIKKLTPKKNQSVLNIYPLNKYTDPLEYRNYLKVCENGISIALMSEAGLPGIADPGAAIVAMAHSKNIQVVPLVGPSSITLAMMSSGLNGQNFAFNGYLPIEKSERKRKIKQFENQSGKKQQSQIFIETPYRNDKLFEDFISVLSDNTMICIAADITLPTEFIKTMPVKAWKQQKLNLQSNI
ncbi:MAG: SAM-dependent methyltransferase [Flavobacteriales bacterium]|nr:MAG: SAM-dependent methyltransferase [Flavobacteriales bacterium]